MGSAGVVEPPVEERVGETQRWRKKNLPNLVVVAVRVTAENAKKVAAWSHADVIEEINPFDPSITQPGLNVPTEQGRERASVGDYVFKMAPEDFRVRTSGAFHSIWEPTE